MAGWPTHLAPPGSRDFAHNRDMQHVTPNQPTTTHPGSACTASLTNTGSARSPPPVLHAAGPPDFQCMQPLCPTAHALFVLASMRVMTALVKVQSAICMHECMHAHCLAAHITAACA